MGTRRAPALSEETTAQAVEVLRAMAAHDRLEVSDLEPALTAVLEARTEEELVAIIEALPSPIAMTPAPRRFSHPLKIRGGVGRVRLDRRWQLARQTRVSAELGSVLVDLGKAEFDETVVDLDIYTGWGSITVVVPHGVGLQVLRSRGTVTSRLDPPVPGFPLVRLDARTNIGRIRLLQQDKAQRPRLTRFPRRRRRQLDR